MEVFARQLVERFYQDVWNKADEAVAREILSSKFQFRASLGLERHGPDAFMGYVRSVRAALAKYQCIVDDLIVSGDRAAARMTFKGIHEGTFFGVSATGREIAWTGAAFFTFNRGQISMLWVLGDLDAVKQQLGAELTSSFAV